MKPRKRSRVPLLLLLLISLLPVDLHAQGGGSGSKGGVVLACFDGDPKTFLVPPATASREALLVPQTTASRAGGSQYILTWPSFIGTDSVVSAAYLYDTINRLRNVEVDEYRDATHRGSQLTTNSLIDESSQLHPLIWLLRRVARAAVPTPISDRLFVRTGITPEHLLNVAAQKEALVPGEQALLEDYINSQGTKFSLQRLGTRPLFERLYWMMVELFRGVPGFYTRLKAAHEAVGWIPDRELNTTGIASIFDDLLPSTIPFPTDSCVQMAAAARSLSALGTVDLTRDPYLWDAMDIFQQVLLQLHEEFYYLGSDSGWIEPRQTTSQPARNLLVGLLKGALIKGEFANKCTVYEALPYFGQIAVQIQSSTNCPTAADDKTFVPYVLGEKDAEDFINSFFCTDGRLGCQSPPWETWRKFALAYSPQSAPQALQQGSGQQTRPLPQEGLKKLLEERGFGLFSSLDVLNEERRKAIAWSQSAIDPYNTLAVFCAKAEKSVAEISMGQRPTDFRWWSEKDRDKKIKRSYSELLAMRANQQDIQKEDTALSTIKKNASGILLQNLDADEDATLQHEYPDELLILQMGKFSTGVPDELRRLPSLDPGENYKYTGRLLSACNNIIRPQLKSLGDFQSFLGFGSTELGVPFDNTNWGSTEVFKHYQPPKLK